MPHSQLFILPIPDHTNNLDARPRTSSPIRRKMAAVDSHRHVVIFRLLHERPMLGILQMGDGETVGGRQMGAERATFAALRHHDGTATCRGRGGGGG